MYKEMECFALREFKLLGEGSRPEIITNEVERIVLELDCLEWKEDYWGKLEIGLGLIKRR